MKFAQLLQRFGTPQGVFSASSRDWVAFGLKQTLIDYLQQADWTAVKQDIAWANVE
ncbi:MAG: hypothetical protein R3E08_03115 [Thiotrichaceae bacterium]